MDQHQDLDAVARDILEANIYMVIATADEEGSPWASPVWFAADGYAEFYWVSSPEVQHSRNLAARPRVYLVVFNSQVPISTGQAVYMSASAAQVTAAADIDRGMEIFSRASVSQGARAWTAADVREPASLRLYRATVTQHWVLDPVNRPDHRVPVHP
jgi:nitroimidazol reductase NimA-like FMN-containing flavoprotein (pyridoxamine 5'-phosphate oxidase superfamily)